MNRFRFCLLALLLLATLASACGKPEGGPHPEKVTGVVPPTYDPTTSRLALGNTGTEVQRLHERLVELGYIEEIPEDGRFNETTETAVEQFQQDAGLVQTGIVDEETYYALYAEDAARYVDFAELAPTINMSFAELVGDDGMREYPKGYPEPDTYSIIVDIEHQVTMVYTKDENGEYTVPVRYMLCSTGAHDRTPKGEFEMDSFRVRFSQFKRDKRYGQYWTQIRGAIYFHTILYTKLEAATYQEDIFELLGTADSHGCVRLTVPDARWMWYHIAPGTHCEVRDGSPDDTETAAIREKLILASPPEEHLDLQPGEIPYTDNWSIDDIPLEVPFVQGSQY